MNDIVVLGGEGQVGAAIVAAARRSGLPHRALRRADCDITRHDEVMRAAEGARIVVNCAAYTAVDKAESDRQAAHAVNAAGAGIVAEACAKHGIPLIHISTDYVFDGSPGRPWRENDPPNPLNVYGRTKLAGEDAVRERLKQHIILRTSWVFSADGENFVKTMLQLARSQAELKIVDDQIGGPTAATDLASAMLRIVELAGQRGFDAWGTYHFGGAPPVSWYEFARTILGDRDVTIRAIKTAAYLRPAQRPKNSVLDCSKIAQVFGIHQPDWHESLERVREEWPSRV